ncbi:hypothetical protein DW954_09265 [Clostridium sp. AM45-5]|nr:hypothetical protein DW954_09265 [Clostridium sp. AM45-5]
MFRFIRGEERHLKFFVHSTENERFKVKEAQWRLLLKGEEEASGVCEVYEAECSKYGWEVDAKISPLTVSRCYELEITLKISDEIVKHRESIEVV